MTNAADCLCVGGPADGRMVCMNRNVTPFPPPIIFANIEDPSTSVTYVAAPWWYDDMEAWYWIATRAEDEVTAGDIQYAIASEGFNPAWDLRDRPAPQPPEEVL